MTEKESITLENKANCLVCGSELIYETQTSEMKCIYCNKSFDSSVKCKNGHFICDLCHSLSANELIRQFCVATELQDPLEMTLILMNHKQIKMHGPEHHFLVPAVLLASYYNQKGDHEKKALKIREAEVRSKNVLGGFCGFYGACGAAIGTGIFLSLITDSTPLSKDEWHLSNLMTSRSLQIIADHGGPRCCKRNTFLAVYEAVKFLDEKFGVKLHIVPDLKCEFSSLNKECRGKTCPFHRRSAL